MLSWFVTFLTPTPSATGPRLLHRPSLVTASTNIHTMTISNLDRIYLTTIQHILTFQVNPGLGGHQQLHPDILPPGTCSGSYLAVQMSGCSIWCLVLDDNFFVLLLGGTSTKHSLLSIPSHLHLPQPGQSTNVSIIHGRLEGSCNLTLFTNSPFLVI